MLDQYIDTFIKWTPEPIKRPFRWLAKVNPNTYTYLRIFAIVPLLLSLIFRDYLLALAVFIFAAITDIIDGYLARKTKNITMTGTIYDPLADKVIFLCAFILTSLELLPHFIYWFIILGESILVIITFLALAMPQKSQTAGVEIGSNCWGKFKMMSESFGIGFMLLYLKTRHFFPALMAITLFSSACVFIILSLRGHLKKPLANLLKK